MDFHITLVGLNHRTASVDVRERFALADYADPVNWAFPRGENILESLILSTCNRVEVLGIGKDNPEQDIIRLWAHIRQLSERDFPPHIYSYHNLEAVRHVFEVASSLDSMVLGEPQILGQLKAAYRKSVESHNAGSIINRMLHKAFSVAKRVRNETAVAVSAVSISYAAVELAKRIFGSMPSHRAMLVGAGEMAELAAMHLLQAGADEIVVANRTLANGEALAKKFNGSAIEFLSLRDHLKDVDILIASTGSKEPIIHVEDVAKALKARKNRPMFFIDIAVPRDIDPAVNELDNVYLYDIDDLREVVEENLAGRKEEAVKARAIVTEEVDNFALWLKNLEVQPTILDLVKRGEDAARIELDRALKKLGPITPNARRELELMAKAIARRMNHAPIMFLKTESMAQEGTLARVNMTRRIFDLDNGPGRGH